MAASANPTADSMGVTSYDETVALYVAMIVDIDRDRARAAFAELDWLGVPTADPPGDGWRGITADLELPVLDDSGPAVRKAAVIEIGRVHESKGGLSVPIAWRSASLTPLFPVFGGHIEVRRSSLVLTGRYAPPFGRMGVLMDQALLHFVADRSARALLEAVAGRCRKKSVGAEPA
jgi:hypothetical protein